MQGQPITDTASLPSPRALPSLGQVVPSDQTVGGISPDSDAHLEGVAFNRLFAEKESDEEGVIKEDGTPDVTSKGREAQSPSVVYDGSLVDYETLASTWQGSLPKSADFANNPDALGHDLNSAELSLKLTGQYEHASEHDKGRQGIQTYPAGPKSTSQTMAMPEIIEDQSLFRKVRSGTMSPTTTENARPEAIAAATINPHLISASLPVTRTVPAKPVSYGDLNSSKVAGSLVQQTQNLGAIGKQIPTAIDQSIIQSKVGEPSGKFATVTSSDPHDAKANSENKPLGGVSKAKASSQQFNLPSLISAKLGALNSNLLPVIQDALLSEVSDFAGHVLPAERGSLQSTSVFQASTTSAHSANAHVMRQIVDAGNTLTKTGGSVEIALNPEELGKVRMVVSPAESGGVVHISAERPETLELVQRNLELLRRDLKDAGWANVAISLADASMGGFTDEQKAGAGNEKPSIHPEPLELDVVPEAERVMQTSMRVRSGLDVRV